MYDKNRSQNSKWKPMPEQQQMSLLSREETVIAYLQQMALPSLFNRLLSESDYLVWQEALRNCSVQAIKYAFENALRNCNTFPKPVQILDLVEAFEIENRAEFRSCNLCVSGWLVEDVPHKDYKSGKHRVARRCSCWQRFKDEHKKAKAA